MNPTENAVFVAHVHQLVKQHGGVARAWAVYREHYEYFDGEREIERFYHDRFYAAARAK